LAVLARAYRIPLVPRGKSTSGYGGVVPVKGGLGYGACEFGEFHGNVVSCRAVSPTGDVRKFGGDTLDLIRGAEGTTGLITQVTISVGGEMEVGSTTWPFVWWSSSRSAAIRWPWRSCAGCRGCAPNPHIWSRCSKAAWRSLSVFLHLVEPGAVSASSLHSAYYHDESELPAHPDSHHPRTALPSHLDLNTT
jgi:FAD/FMN-containing dehydrogenase